MVMPEPASGMAMVWLAMLVFQVAINGCWFGVCCACAKGRTRAAVSLAGRMAQMAARMMQVGIQNHKSVEPARRFPYWR